MSDVLRQQLELLPANLASHLLVTVLPLLLGIALSVPLAIVAVKSPMLRYPVLTLVGVIQTIPSLALLALTVPVLVAVGGLAKAWWGVEISALGFYPAVIALTLYSMLPIVRNTVTGILDVDPAMTEAARGVGMTARQSLWQVELPLAAPVIVAGIRTATVWTVGIATLATPVGQRCLGNFIFSGLQTRNWTAVLIGCISAAVLAILLDALIGGLQKSIQERRRRLGLFSGGLLLLVVVGGMFAPTAVSWARASRGSDLPLAATTESGGRLVPIDAAHPLVIGSKTFTEQYILTELVASRLAAAGLPVSKTESLGSTVIFDGLLSGQIDCYVDYTGTIWANHMHRDESAPAWSVLDQVSGWLAAGRQARCLGALGFENAYALAMRRDQAEALSIGDIDDLARHSAELKIGGDYEFFGRPEWANLKRQYGLSFAEHTNFDSTFMYDAVETGQIDVISAFSSDGRIAAGDLVVLEDPRGAIPPYDAIVLLSVRAAEQPKVAAALRPLLGAISVDLMRQANYQVDRDEERQTVQQAAAWLDGQIESSRRNGP